MKWFVASLARRLMLEADHLTDAEVQPIIRLFWGRMHVALITL